MKAIQIRSASISADISPTGAELQSLLSVSDGEEYLWQGDSKVWGGRAPILFPIVGALKHSNCQHNGRPVKLDKHGFARAATFQLMEQEADRAVFQLTSSSETADIYPWTFQLLVRFQIEASTLTIHYTVRNTDSAEMLFNIGSHPAFRLPLENNRLNDFSIGFDQAEDLQLFGVTDSGLLTTDSCAYPLQAQSITLDKNLFDNDALVFRHINSRQIALQHKTLGRRLSVNTGGAPHLGIWAKPGAEFVCIEPWWGHADFDNASDQFSEKDSVQRLASGATFDTFIQIEIDI